MTKFWIVFRREYAQVVKKKSFLVGIFLTPVLMAGFAIVPALLAGSTSSRPERIAVVDQSDTHIGEEFVASLERYTLDDSVSAYDVVKLIVIQPSEHDRMTRISDSLSDEINAKRIKYAVVINPEPQVDDSNLYVITNSDNFTTLKRFEKRLSQILSQLRLRSSDINLDIDSVLTLTRRLDLQTRDALGQSIPFEIKYFSAIVFVMIMFAMILGYGQMVMRSVIDEKNSRVMEVLLSSITPFQLMVGKITGLGAAAMTQVSIWVMIGAGFYFMKGSLAITNSIDRIIFNPVIVIFFVCFLIIGYIMFSTLFALVGSIVSSEKEAQSFVAPISMLLVVPLVMGLHIVQNPDSTLSLTMSMIPLVAPTAMMMRIIFLAPTLTNYSFFGSIIGEATLSLFIVTATTIGLIWLTAKVFRVGILMYGKRPTLPEILKWIRY